MKILYAIQGTGNGHLSRAREIIPHLKKHSEVDILVSGLHNEINTGYEVKYTLKGLGFYFGKNGGIDLVETYRKNHIRILKKEIRDLPVDKYDLVLNDFEPVSAWSCYLKNIPCIALSHQAAVVTQNSPKPTDTDILGRSILLNYAPANKAYGFHFKSYDAKTFTPVIRSQIRNSTITSKGHYTVYLPAFSEKKLISVFHKFKDVKWEIFSKHCKTAFKDKNINLYPVNNERFISSMAASDGIVCGAGFETPAEALFMNKKLLVIPMKGQYEQACNAAALHEMGIPVIKNFKHKANEKIRQWIENKPVITVDYPDITETILLKILDEKQSAFQPDLQTPILLPGTKQLKKLLLKELIINI